MASSFDRDTVEPDRETVQRTDSVQQRQPGIEAPGGNIGHYRLLALIGEGGFGTVWLAERREPMVQRVAIKIIKAGMDSREVIARFEQERQALAVMDHPNVAKVLDAGTTSPDLGSRPFFVMEYVKGEPITAVCDKHRLTIRQRLELFIPVCEAVQHAHHKGIIHRDIKPSNVLVTMVGGAPAGASEGGREDESSGSVAVRGALVKVIDFGIAKAMSRTLTEKTIFTEEGRMIGTPEYMSPEQAEMGAMDIDTRTDVYSLGVLLYELLTGMLPFDPRELRSKGYAEVQRIIREVEPPRPSTKLSGGGDRASGSADDRAVGLGELLRQLRRELEWIPLRAMAKDRARRYPSPMELAEDIRNYLGDRPLVAGPESAWYRTGKLLSRRRGVVAFAASLGAVVAAGAFTSLHLWRRAAQLSAEADAGAVISRVTNDFISDSMLPLIARTREGYEETIPALLEGAARELDQPINAGEDDPAVVRSREPQILAQLRSNLAESCLAFGKATMAREQLVEALRLQESVLGREHHRALMTRGNLGWAYSEEKDYPNAVRVLEEAVAAWDSRAKADREGLAPALHALGVTYRRMKRRDDALRTLSRASELWKGRESHWRAWQCMNSLGLVHQDRGELADAERLFREAVSHAGRSKFATSDKGLYLSNLAVVLAGQGRYEEAEAAALQAAEEFRETLFPEHRHNVGLIGQIAELYSAWPGHEAQAAEWSKRAQDLKVGAAPGASGDRPK